MIPKNNNNNKIVFRLYTPIEEMVVIFKKKSRKGKGKIGCKNGYVMGGLLVL